MTDFRKALDLVRPAVSKDESRPNMCCIRIDDGYVIATDGHRLHAVKLEELDGIEPFSVAVNCKAATLEGARKKAIENKARFPEWKRVVPNKSRIVYTGSVDLFIDGLKCLITAFHQTRRNEFGVQFREDILYAQCFSTEMEMNGDVTLTGKTQDHKPFGFNAFYMLDALTALKTLTDTVEVRNTDEFSPIVIRHESLTTVIMPMRL